jgi:Ca-activated chloride channel family protein
MEGTSMHQAKAALKHGLGFLGQDDRFNLIRFSSDSEKLWTESVPADSAYLEEADWFIDSLSANGGTVMAPALGMAMSLPPQDGLLRQIVFITDGSVGNEQELFELIEAGLGNSRLFTVGIGSAPNGWFMRKAAEAGHGSYTLISALHEIDEKMGRLFRKIENPQLTDVAIQWPSGVQVEAYPHTVADLYAGEPVIVKAKSSSEFRKGSTIIVSGNSVMGRWGSELAVDASQGSPGIAAVWARARIEDLLDGVRRGADPDDARSAVIETAMRHHLVSRFTSLVAVDKTPSRPKGAGLSNEQVPNLLPYGQSQSAIFGFPATATGAGLHRFIGAACLLLALLMLALRRRSRDGRFVS